jgi:adenylate cyclase
VRLDAFSTRAQDTGVNGSPHLKRRLAAIAFADVAGFSRLIATDEAGTLRRWKVLRTEIMEPCTVEHGGRVAEVAGDAVLVEFPSVVSSLRWAIDVQRAVSSRQTKWGSETLNLRIGINVEDVIDDDVFCRAMG